METLKKIFVGIFTCALSTISFGASTVPVSLINPAGSSSGQVIASTGSSTAPGWSTLAGIGGITAASAAATYAPINGAVLVNPTTNSTPAAGDQSAKIPNTNWVAAYFLTPTGANSLYGAKAGTLAQFSATTSAQLAGVLSDETGSGSVVFGTSPTITTPNIVGATNGAAAAAGSVGEQPTANASTVSLTSGIAANATSKLLTAGQYLVWCTAQFLPAGSTVGTVYAVGISTTSATRPGSYANETLNQYSSTAGMAQQVSSPIVPMNVSANTTAYCVAYAGFSTSTMTVSGTINALRVR